MTRSLSTVRMSHPPLDRSGPRRFVAAARGAAFLAALALAQPSHASVIHRQVNVQHLGDQSYAVDVNGDGVADFTITQSITGDTLHGCFRAAVTETPALNNGVAAQHSTKLILGLASGTTIGRFRVYYLDPEGLFGVLSHNSQRPPCKIPPGNYGYWMNTGNHYLGFEFKINGRTHFGYALFSAAAYLSPADHHYTVSTYVTEYAYESTPNVAIIVGN